jgi:hypothetical protein
MQPTPGRALYQHYVIDSIDSRRNRGEQKWGCNRRAEGLATSELHWVICSCRKLLCRGPLVTAIPLELGVVHMRMWHACAKQFLGN